MDKTVDKRWTGRQRAGRRNGRRGGAALLWTAAAALLGAASARAGLPDVADPSTGAVDDGDFIGMLQAYGLDIVVLGGLGLSAIALLVVAKNVISKYSMVADGRATWGEVGMHGAVGVVLLVIVIFLATQSATVLA